MSQHHAKLYFSILLEPSALREALNCQTNFPPDLCSHQNDVIPDYDSFQADNFRIAFPIKLYVLQIKQINVLNNFCIQNSFPNNKISIIKCTFTLKIEWFIQTFCIFFLLSPVFKDSMIDSSALNNKRKFRTFNRLRVLKITVIKPSIEQLLYKNKRPVHDFVLFQKLAIANIPLIIKDLQFSFFYSIKLLSNIKFQCKILSAIKITMCRYLITSFKLTFLLENSMK